MNLKNKLIAYIRGNKLPPQLFFVLTKLYRRYPLYDKNQSANKMIFIVGSGRSGTTLLRSMLWAGKIAAIPPETYGLKKAVLHFTLYNFKPWEKLALECINIIRYHGDVEQTWDIDFDKVYSIAREFPKKKRTAYDLIECIYRQYQIQKGNDSPFWGDKTPNNTLGIRWLFPAFRNSYYLHLVRNGVDVANSYAKSGIKAVGSYQNGLIRWKTAVNQVFSLFRNSELKNITVKYEALVADPEAEMKKIYQFLDLPYSEGWREHNTVFDKMGDTTQYDHHKNVSKKIENFHVKKDRGEIREKFIQKEMQELSYL